MGPFRPQGGGDLAEAKRKVFHPNFHIQPSFYCYLGTYIKVCSSFLFAALICFSLRVTSSISEFCDNIYNLNLLEPSKNKEELSLYKYAFTFFQQLIYAPPTPFLHRAKVLFSPYFCMYYFCSNKFSQYLEQFLKFQLNVKE